MNIIEKCLNDQIDEIRSQKGKVLDSGVFFFNDKIIVCTDFQKQGEIWHLEDEIGVSNGL